MDMMSLLVKALILTDKYAPSVAYVIRKIKPKLKKEELQILFIDDETMPIVNILREARYNVRKKQSVTSEDDVDIRNSHVIFVDYNGVGQKLSNYEGAGLIKRIRDKYQKTKYLVLYTAMQNLPTETVTSGFLDYADSKMRKSASKDEFIGLLDKAINQL